MMRILIASVSLLFLILSGLPSLSFGIPNLHQQRGNEGATLDCSDPTGLYYREAIPSIDDPHYENVNEADSYLDAGDRIFGFSIDGEWYGYPVRIMNRHEVVNDHTLGMAITYCPLTGSPLVYPTEQLNGSEIGVTGILFESNLVFYDRDSDSCFVQMLSLGMSGPRIGQRLSYLPIVDMFWDEWKLFFPESHILSRNSGFDQDFYKVDQYRGYSTDSSLLYPANYLEREPYNLQHPKERTLVIEHGNQTYLFAQSEFSGDSVVQFNVGDNDFVVFFDSQLEVMQPYKVADNQTFSPQRSKDNTLMFIDSDGVVYDILGKSMNDSVDLTRIPSFLSYWYAATVFFPNSRIFRFNSFVEYENTAPAPNIVVPASETATRLVIVGVMISVVVLVVIGGKFVKHLRSKNQ